MKRQKSSIGGFLKGILIGGFLGGTLALFTTPHSGVETRRLLRKKSKQLKNKTARTIEDAQAQIDSTISDFRQNTNKLAQRFG